jgi:hypothetical protein
MASHELLQKIAVQIFIGLGFSTDKDTLKNTVLSIAHNFPGTEHLKYTEQYFYEETIFAGWLCTDAEYRFGYIQFVIDAWNKKVGGAAGASRINVTQAIHEIIYPLARERMKYAGIKPTPDGPTGNPEEFFRQRWEEYDSLFMAHLNCNEPFDEQRSGIGLSNREHPTDQYLGAISDHICEALGVLAYPKSLRAQWEYPSASAMATTALELALTQRWIVALSVAGEATTS